LCTLLNDSTDEMMRFPALKSLQKASLSGIKITNNPRITNADKPNKTYRAPDLKIEFRGLSVANMGDGEQST